MKNRRTLFSLAFAGLLISAMGCDSVFNNGVNSVDESSLTQLDELAKSSTLDYEAATAEAAGCSTLTDKDAVFSLGFSEFYDPFEETVKERSDAFAVAPDSETFSGLRPRAGKDMGTVTLSYNGSSVELQKVEHDGGIFYNYGRRMPGNPRGEMHGDNGEVGDAIPYLPGTTYTFAATGAGDFPALSLDLTTPATALQITNPAEGSDIDASSDLTVTWQGGESSSNLMLSVVPILDRANFEGPNARYHEQGSNGRPLGGGHPHGGKPFGRDGMEPGQFHDLHLRIVIEENNGSYTIPASDIATVLDIENVIGIAVHVSQLQSVEIEDGDASYAMILRQGDSVRFNIAAE
ncbi:MAG: hypothetical protein H6695_05405 [Deferribacteres bacterium]|nr:hypothetical protein [candidate division KSB1 bacterium]MCB9509595.1 hypothetical protein [Deferribacteres bacterium]